MCMHMYYAETSCKGTYSGFPAKSYVKRSVKITKPNIALPGNARIKVASATLIWSLCTHCFYNYMIQTIFPQDSCLTQGTEWTVLT